MEPQNIQQPISEGQVDNQSNLQTGGDVIPILTHPQISLLQIQIRQFKQLTKRYTDSKFSKWLLENESMGVSSGINNKLLTNNNSQLPSQTINNNNNNNNNSNSFMNASQSIGVVNPNPSPMTHIPSMNHNNNSNPPIVSNPAPTYVPSTASSSHVPSSLPPQYLQSQATFQPKPAAPNITSTAVINNHNASSATTIIREPVQTIALPWRPVSATLNCGPKAIPEGAVGAPALVRNFIFV